MSIANMYQFEQNLRRLVESKAFKLATEAEKLDLGYRLANSKYGGSATLPTKKSKQVK